MQHVNCYVVMNLCVDSLHVAYVLWTYVNSLYVAYVVDDDKSKKFPFVAIEHGMPICMIGNFPYSGHTWQISIMLIAYTCW